jgi:membrane protease subunit (stomatin/prohibitin family)
MRWGTKDPVAFKDAELGLIRLRAFGLFTMKVTQPLLFVNTLVGTKATLDTAEVEDLLRTIIVSRLNDFLGETVDSLLNLPRYYDEMAVAVRTRLVEDFRKYGMELVDFFINRITPPEEVQKMIDERSGMAAVGNLDSFFKFKVAKAVGDAAASGSGLPGGSEASAGMGIGVGAGLGMMIPGMLFERPGSVKGSPVLPQTSVNCPECHGAVPLDSRFCLHCGHQLVVVKKCPRCGQNLAAEAKFCSACGLDQQTGLRCSACGASLPPETRFCLQCGEKVLGPEGQPGGS